MTTLTVNIENKKDLPILKEILNRFGLQYKIDTDTELSKNEEKLYKTLQKSFDEIKDWEKGKINLQSAKEALTEIETELDNGI